MRHKGVKLIGHTCDPWCWTHLNVIQLLISFFFCTETQQCLKTDKTLRKVTVFMRNNSIIKMNLNWNFLTLFKTKRGKREQDREWENRTFREGGALALGPWAQKVLQCCFTNSLNGKHLSAPFPLFSLSLPPLTKTLQVHNTNATQTCSSVSRSQTLKIQCKNPHYFLYHIAYIMTFMSNAFLHSVSRSSVPWANLGSFSFIVWRIYCS